MTLRQLVKFVLTYRGTSVFVGMDEDEIGSEIYLASKEERLAYHEEEGRITGLMILDIDRANKILFVRRNLNITPAAIMAMCSMFLEYFRDYRLQGYKHHFKEYKDPQKLVTRWASMAQRKLEKQQLPLNNLYVTSI